MMKKSNKRFFTQHAKSSAALVSLGIHAVLIVVALSFVAVTVINKEDKQFEAKPVSRPQMHLKKLQVPVNIKKKKVQKPKLRKRIVVQPKVSRNTPDIRMPEIAGVKGGLGNAGGGGLGGAGGLGFSMPEIELFGVKGKGEKIVFVLDASPGMMVDEIGGVRAYEIIKSELVRILGNLNSSVLFNVAVYQEYSSKMLFPKLVPASTANVASVEEWLKPLNRFEKNRNEQRDYGIQTTGKGGVEINQQNRIAPLMENQSHWVAPAIQAMRDQADTVFILTSNWGFIATKVKGAGSWSEAKMERWNKKVAEAKAKHEEENTKRAAMGEAPRIISGIPYERHVVLAYFPGTEIPPQAEWRRYTPRELADALVNTRMKYQQEKNTLTGKLRNQKESERFSINVIQFVPEGGEEIANFKTLTGRTRGAFSLIKGLAAVESYLDRAE